MRLSYVVLVAVATLFASTQALLNRATTDPSPKSNIHTGAPRFLRTDVVADEDPITEERRLVNIDLALREAAHALRKKTKWKVQFTAWKAMNKTPFKLSQELGIAEMGNATRQHPKWKKLMKQV
ncbi:unnamed protein product [Phytophthora lilii]|uniref:RxLR effector protein n=1 Tax=Phytophthora lilii TaxID=2077276 RepID=A0A9W6X0U4_9STRA|nr:unnamed protein product [Phytophthora lilii]